MDRHKPLYLRNRSGTTNGTVGGREELGEERVGRGGGEGLATSSLGATWQAQLGEVGLKGEGDEGEAWRRASQTSGQRVGGKTWMAGCRRRGAS